MSLEIYKKMELESKLKELICEGKTKEEAFSSMNDEDDLEIANYLIEAYLMPIDEITNEIEKYHSNNFRFDEIMFIDELCKKYNVDRKTIIQRIENVRKINKQKFLYTKERLQRLKNKRDSLQREKDKLQDKSMDVEEKSMYYFGLVIITIVGGLLFFQSSPILVGLIPIAYAVGIPTMRTTLLLKEEFVLINQLVDLGKEIQCVESKLNERENKKEFNELKKSNSDNEYTCLELKNNNLENCNDPMISTLDNNDSNRISGPTLVKRKK